MIGDVVRQGARDGCHGLLQVITDLADREACAGASPAELMVVKPRTQDRVQAPRLRVGGITSLGEAHDDVPGQISQITKARSSAFHT